MRSKWFFLLVATLATASLWGCGSSGGSGGSAVTPTDGGAAAPTVELLGISNCSNCHSAQIAAWKDGRHGNITGPSDPSPSGPHEPAAAGEPLSCGNCHNATLDATNMPAAFNVSIRDVVACESCHGGGSAHRGIGPIPVPIPGVDACAKCHAEVDATTGDTIALRSRGGHSPAATTAVTDYLVSGHAGDPRDRSTRSDAIGCNRCHSDEGAKLYMGLNTIDAITDADGRGRGAMPLGEENITSIQCRTCHDVHDTGGNKLLLDATADASAQYNTCNHCHAGDNADLNYHVGHADDNGLLDRQIDDTHYDDPATNVDNTKVIEGYVIRQQADSACADCHNVHSGDNTINNQWAKSAHGGQILTAKLAAAAAGGDVMTAGGNDDADSPGFAAGWAHYNWDDNASRAACQHCHTATGAANFLDDPANYVAANNDFSHLADWSATGGSHQQEVLYCWGCHDNAGAGTLRNTGAIPLDFTVDGQAASLTAADGNSAVCLSCHSGRGNADTLLNGRTIATPEATTGYRNGGTSTHYLVAGGTIFQAQTKTGYTFGLPAEKYADPSYFAHDSIGCAECHMSGSESHSFNLVEKDDAGYITALTATNCIECHSGAHGAALAAGSADAAAFLQEEAEGYHQAMQLLAQVLTAAGTPPQSGYPYFSGTPVNEGHSGAMHNYSYLHHEPGAYAHNRYYAKRLIYDSLDWLDNYVLDESVTIDSVSYPYASHWLGSARP